VILEKIKLKAAERQIAHSEGVLVCNRIGARDMQSRLQTGDPSN
jgi:hypothetical protein